MATRLHSALVRLLCKLRQVIFDFIPRGFMTHPNMRLWADARITLNRTETQNDSIWPRIEICVHVRATPGTFTVRTELTSIDTDTGGADNGAGETPQQASMDRDVTIVAVTAIPTVPQWGMIVLTLSLLTLATWQLVGRPVVVSVGGTGSVSLASEPQSWLRSLVLGQIVAGGGLLLYALSGPLMPHDGLGTFVAGLLIGTMIEMYQRRGE